jgi:hypothetical protein
VLSRRRVKKSYEPVWEGEKGVDPSVKSSPIFLCRNPWAREKLEDWYVREIRKARGFGMQGGGVRDWDRGCRGSGHRGMAGTKCPGTASLWTKDGAAAQLRRRYTEQA